MKKVLVIFMMILLSPILVNAHVRILQSSPEPGAILTKAPEKIVIEFLGSVEPAFSKIEVYDSKGRKVSKKTTFRENDTIMEVELEKNLPPGTYTVRWQCLSIDGHMQKKKFTFTIK